MPSISQLSYLLAVERFGHFAKAAKHCHIAQPSLSIQIQKVEEELDMMIFDRNKKPIVVTQKGEVLLKHAKTVLREHEKLLAAAKSQKGQLSGQLTLGVIPTILPYLLPLFLKNFAEKYPAIELNIEEMKTEDIITNLKNDSVDVAILATPLKEKGIREQVLFYEPFVAYFNKGHRLAKQAKLKSKDLEATDIWLLKDGHCLRNQVSNLCGRKNGKGIFDNIRFEGANLETLRSLIQETEGYTLLPWMFARKLPKKELEQCTKTFQKPIPAREVSLVFSREQWKKDMIAALKESLLASLPEDVIANSSPKYDIVGIE